MKKRLRVSVSALFLVLALVVTQIPAEQVVADTAAVSKDTEFQLNGNLLVKYTGDAKIVAVPASVTVIGEEAFADNTTMEILQFKGNKVETIAYRAFAGCTALKELRLPNSVQELGNGAFSNCTGLQKVTIGTELYKLGIGPFAGCTALKEIVIEKGNTSFSVADGCLYNSDKSKLYLLLPGREGDNYAMPSTVTDIAEYALWGCDNVKSISLSSYLKKIPDYSFSNCKSLTRITIPYSVRSIGLLSFSDCVNLETVIIPASVITIDDTAFNGCSKLIITADEGTAAYQYYEVWKLINQAEYEDTDPIETDKPHTDKGNTGKEEDTDPSGDVSDPDDNEKGPEDLVQGNLIGSTFVVGNRAVVFIDNSSLTVQESIEKTNEASVSAGDTTAEGYQKEWAIPKFTIAFDHILADQAFYKSREIGEYDIPDEITEIGEFTFARSNLVIANIPEGVTTIGYGAFYHCDYLRDVRIPSSVIFIAPKAFSETLWLNSWLSESGNEDYLVVGNGILLAYRGEGGNIILPDTVKRIAPDVFAGNNSIISVNIPDSVIEIGEDAFNGCKNLKTVSGGQNVRVIRDRAFYGCGLETAHIWKNVEYIGLKSFDFSTTSLSLSYKVVVFDSTEKLPSPSYELTAERLSNEEARGSLLGDTLIAIVDKKIKAEELTDTVLAPDVDGFKGIVAYISSRDKQEITCIATTYTEEELANAYIPTYINIDGKNYEVIGIENITVFGRNTDYPKGNIDVRNQSTVLENEVINARLEGNNGSYYLKIADSEDAFNLINAGYQAVYREDLPPSSLCVDMSLIERKTNIPITKTGAQALSITLTLPDTIAGNNLRILTTDRNGQIENIPYTRDGENITFETNHFSSFAFVRTGSTLFGSMDASPDTGDYLNPKWFLAAGLASIGIGVLFIKKKKNK